MILLKLTVLLVRRDKFENIFSV